MLRPRRCQDPRSGIDKADSISLPGFLDASPAILRVFSLGMIFLFYYLLGSWILICFIHIVQVDAKLKIPLQKSGYL